MGGIHNAIYGYWLWALALGCAASVLQSCKVTEPTIVTEIVERTIRIDSTIIEFLDTTVCPPNLTDTLLVTKVITKTLPARDIVVRDTVVDTLNTQSLIDRVVTKYVDKNVTSNNWWLLAIGLIIGFYAHYAQKNYRDKRRDL